MLAAHVLGEIKWRSGPIMTNSNYRDELRHAAIFIGVLVLAYLAINTGFRHSVASSNYALVTTVLLGLYLARLLSMKLSVALIVVPIFAVMSFVSNLTGALPFPVLRYDNSSHLIVLSLISGLLFSVPIMVDRIVRIVFR